MSKYLKYYQPHEKVMVWNDDIDLTPIEYELPDPPPLETIEGYGLPPKQQFWKHKPLPPKLEKINLMTKDEEGNELTPRLKMKILEKDPEYYKEEIDYIEKEWERRENGFWFFNNGVPTMITPDHYWQLQWWPIDGAPPDYRNYDRRWFWFWYMVENDDNCFGFNNPKPRRVGATIKVCGIRSNRASSQPYYTTGLQSKDEKHAEEVHFINTYEPFRTVPFFFQPITDSGNNTWKEIRFFSPTSKQHPDRNQPALNSFLDYRDSGVTAYDGTKRWLIHNDEPGKTVEIDINERVRVQLPCLTNIERGTARKGKLINTSTTGEMDRGGGKMFKKLCDASDYHKRDANGMTESGLYTLFQSVKEGMEGIDPITKQPFIDRFGNANAEAIERYRINKRESLRDAGNIAGYIDECRQYPIRYADCWKTSARQCIFNVLKIEERLDHYRNGNPDKIQGNFEWIAGPDSKVRWVPTDNGRWFISWNFKDPAHANRAVIDENGKWLPANKAKFIAGGDPFKFDKTKKTKRSDGAGAVFYKFDGSIDGNKENSSQWESNRFICTYSNRPPTKEDYGEDMIMMCVYFGCEMFPEMNVTFLADYFQSRGYGGYLYYKFDPATGKYANAPGDNTHIKQVQQIFANLQTYIEHHALRERHDELLSQWKELVDDLQDFDLSVATGYALIGAGDMSYLYEESTTAEPDLYNYFQRFKY